MYSSLKQLASPCRPQTPQFPAVVIHNYLLSIIQSRDCNIRTEPGNNGKEKKKIKEPNNALALFSHAGTGCREFVTFFNLIESEAGLTPVAQSAARRLIMAMQSQISANFLPEVITTLCSVRPPTGLVYYCAPP